MHTLLVVAAFVMALPNVEGTAKDASSNLVADPRDVPADEGVDERLVRLLPIACGALVGTGVGAALAVGTVPLLQLFGTQPPGPVLFMMPPLSSMALVMLSVLLTDVFVDDVSGVRTTILTISTGIGAIGGLVLGMLGGLAYVTSDRRPALGYGDTLLLIYGPALAGSAIGGFLLGAAGSLSTEMITSTAD